MWKRSIPTGIIVFAVMQTTLLWCFNHTLDINIFHVKLPTLIVFIMMFTALFSYLTFCGARKLLIKKIPSKTSFAEQVWGITVGCNIMYLIVAFYQDGLAGIFLVFYIIFVYGGVGVLTFLDYLFHKCIDALNKRETTN